MTDRLYAYLVVAGADGTLSIDTSVGDAIDVLRPATLSDIVDSARKIAADVERDLIVSSVANRVAEAFATANPAKEEPTVGSLVAAKLAERKLVESVPEAETDDPE